MPDSEDGRGSDQKFVAVLAVRGGIERAHRTLSVGHGIIPVRAPAAAGSAGVLRRPSSTGNQTLLGTNSRKLAVLHAPAWRYLLAEPIRYAVWRYVRFSLRLCMVVAMLAARDISVTL